MSPISAVTHDDEAIEAQTIALEPPPAKPAGPPAPSQPLLAPRGKDWLNQSLLELSDTRPPKRWWEFVFAFSFEALVIVVLILIPLMYTDAIDLKQLTATYLVAPPPPPPPPPPPAVGVVKVASVKRVFTQAGRLIAPTAVPQTVAMLKEEALPPDVGGSGGVEGGVPGGVPGGQMGGVLGGVLGGIVSTTAKPPGDPTLGTRAKPVRIGGNIQPPRAIYSPQPMYPTLARQAKIQGAVQINAIIDAEGNVVEMKVVSGHALLLQNALDAVSKWKYQPTILNGTPVAVELIVTVHFRLS